MSYPKNEYCHTCPQDLLAEDGDCTRTKPDGFVARCGPPWTIEKHWYVEGYCEILLKAMLRSFPTVNFIDLFAGPGLYYHRSSGMVFEGSPLIASNYDFKKIILSDLNKENIKALKFRLKNSNKDLVYLSGDVNKLTENINTLLAPDSLSFCLADPDNMRQLEFKTLKKLADGRKVDLLINFPYGNSFKRGVNNVLKSEKKDTAFDLYFGTSEWKDIFRRFDMKFSSEMAVAILELYLSQFYKIGYEKPQSPFEKNYLAIKNTVNREIYFLVFLSKNQLGYKFWYNIVKYTKGKNLNLGI
jgi:three-Cys-motif partner protein